MKIIYEGKEKSRFHDVNVGEVFVKDVAWMKITPMAHVNGTTYNVVDLETGKPSCFDNLDVVQIVKTTLTVEY